MIEHRLGFKGMAIACKCGAEFGSAQREAMVHLKVQVTHAKTAARDAERERIARTRALKGEAKIHERRQLMVEWRRTADLARVFGLSRRHARRWLHAQGPLHVQARRPTKRKDLEWRAVVG